jgi:regulatory protein YycH of two-component signal transduction system YycFG
MVVVVSFCVWCSFPDVSNAASEQKRKVEKRKKNKQKTRHGIMVIKEVRKNETGSSHSHTYM